MVSEKHLKLHQFDEKGWIPGPKEEEAPFFERVATLDRFFSYPPEDIDCFLTDRDWEPAREKVEALFGFSPDWIVAHYDNRNLSFFQGAATWITRKKEIQVPLIQLKKKFESGKLLRLYHRDEVLAHEAVHAARMQFDEPRFEEIFAYRTSKGPLRKFFGPLFEKPWESYLFLGLLFIPTLLEIIDIFVFPIGSYRCFGFLPLAFLGYLLGRLIFLQVTLRIALKRLSKWLLNPEKKWAVALRLSDREIFQFAFQDAKFLKEDIKEDRSLRMQLLKGKYFKKKFELS